MPSTADEIADATDLYNMKQMPRTIGCIDGSNIPIVSPGGDNAEYYRNRKGYFSINVQTICNANYKFNNIVSRYGVFTSTPNFTSYFFINLSNFVLSFLCDTVPHTIKSSLIFHQSINRSFKNQEFGKAKFITVLHNITTDLKDEVEFDEEKDPFMHKHPDREQ